MHVTRYLLFLIYTYFFGYIMKIKMSLVSTIRSGWDADQRELVEANVLDLGYRATPVLPELGGKACEKPPRSDIRRSRLDPYSSPPEVVVAPPDALRHLAESSLLLRGLGRINN
jgi:hypothetical protein